MEAKVIKRFLDKNTKKVFEVGATYESGAERIKELQKLGYLGELIEKPIDPRLEGSVQDVKKALDGLGPDEFRKILVDEKSNKNRKGVIEHIENYLSVIDEK